ncbi:MAG: hypothetical protein WB948_15715 [Desulfobaccales bacterium]
MKRRQRLVYSLLEELKIGIPEEKAPPAPPAPPPINAEISPGSTVGAPALVSGLGYATEVSFPPQRGVEAAALVPKEISLPSPGIVRLSAESYDYGAILLGDHQDWVVVVHNDGERECTILSLEGLPGQGFTLPDPPMLPQMIPPQGSQALSIRFAPDSEGKKAATLAMTVWSQNEQILEVPLRGCTLRLETRKYHWVDFSR